MTTVGRASTASVGSADVSHDGDRVIDFRAHRSHGAAMAKGRSAVDAAFDRLQGGPDEASVCFALGLRAYRQGFYATAATHFHRAVAIDPGHADYAAHWASALAAMGHVSEALQAANRAAGQPPVAAHTWDLLGTVYDRCVASARALHAFAHATNAAPAEVAYRFRYARTLIKAGRVEEGRDELETVLRLEETWWEAYLLLARVNGRTGAEDALLRLKRLTEAHSANLSAQIYLHMAMGHACEALGEHAQAFAHFSRAKAHVQPVDVASGARMARIVDGLIRDFPKAHLPEVGHDTAEPIFVLGLPHTGVELVEALLASHPDVHALDHTQRFGTAFQAMSHSVNTSVFDIDGGDESRSQWWRQLGEHYLESTRPMTDERPFFIDAWPHNYLYLGLIARALPRAKIIVVTRHPLDAAAASFCDLLPMDSEFSDHTLNLDAIGQHWVQYARLMSHWRSVLPSRIHEVSFEALVANPHAMAQRLRKHCGLPEFPGGVDAAHWITDASLAPLGLGSASSLGCVGGWRRFETELAPLHRYLEDHGVSCADADCA